MHSGRCDDCSQEENGLHGQKQRSIISNQCWLMEVVIASNVGPSCLCVEVGCDTVKEPTENEQRYCFWQSGVVVRSPPSNLSTYRARVQGGAVNRESIALWSSVSVQKRKRKA